VRGCAPVVALNIVGTSPACWPGVSGSRGREKDGRSQRLAL